MIAPQLSQAEARRCLSRLLEAAELTDAAFDARIFVEEAVGRDRVASLQNADRPIGERAAAKLAAWLARRLAGEPVWRILGQREFWGLTFTITPDVLDPRPDTETIVSAALAALPGRGDDALAILDLGIGSGAILCALLSERPKAMGWGIDRSSAAARVAHDNVAALGLASRCLVLQGDWASALPDHHFDLIVSNPPYIETAVIATLDREVRDHDPHVALDGGPDGLDCYRAITRDLLRLLRPDGVAVLEVGAGQAGAVERLVAAGGLTLEPARRDLGGHERAVIGRALLPLREKVARSAG